MTMIDGARNPHNLIAFLKENQISSRRWNPWCGGYFSYLLKNGDYILAITKMRDSERIPQDVVFLADNHAPVLFEYAVLAYQNASNDKKSAVLRQVSCPLMVQGNFRALQDAECSMDPSVKVNAVKLTKIYEDRLKNEIRKHTGREFFFKRDTRKMNRVILEMAEKSKISPLPSANWIGEIGDWLQFKNVSEVSKSSGLTMKPESNHQTIRYDYAEKVIRQIKSEQKNDTQYRMKKG